MTLSEQLFLQSSYFFRVTLFLKEPAVSEYLIFWSKLPQSMHFLKIGSSLRRLPFGTVNFLPDELLRIKIEEDYFFGEGTSAQHQLFQKSYSFEKANFSYKKILCIFCFFYRATFVERSLFQQSLSSIAATFLEEPLSHNFFRRVAISQLQFLSSDTLYIYQLVIK